MADLVAELKKSGESVPAEVMRDLRSAKTMVEILKLDRSHSENLLRIEEYLTIVESYLMLAADKRFGKRYVDEWMSKIAEAKKTVDAREIQPSTRFPVGVPRDKHWVRIKPSEEISEEKIRHFSEEMGLTYKAQKDGYVLVYGEEDEVKRFVKKTAELFRKSERQC